MDLISKQDISKQDISKPMSHKTRLRIYRKNIAYKKGTHPNNIFTNEVLENLMQISPKSMRDFDRVRGFGTTKIDA